MKRIERLKPKHHGQVVHIEFIDNTTYHPTIGVLYYCPTINAWYFLNSLWPGATPRNTNGMVSDFEKMCDGGHIKAAGFTRVWWHLGDNEYIEENYIISYQIDSFSREQVKVLDSLVEAL